MKIFTLLIIITAVATTQSVVAQDERTMLAVFWNLENFFDYIDGGNGESDKEFSSYGSRHWTKKRFHTKCDAVAKSFLWITDRYGHMPDVIALAEIENRGVLNKLLNATLLRKYDYSIIHFDSGDRRGIDCAILYRRSSFELLNTTLKTPEYGGKVLSTRDILHAKFLSQRGKSFDVIVNHHPSKYGGARESEGRRAAAMNTLKELCDSLLVSTRSDGIIAMGDFNDTPDSQPFDIIETTLVNKGISLYEKGEGSIRFEGKWDLIDMFLVSPEIDDITRMDVCRIPFLMVRDSGHPGEKPLRTYSGPRYIGGVSDHCPIILDMAVPNPLR